MDRYQITITFKDYKYLEITLDTDEDMKNVLSDGMDSENVLLIGNHIISSKEVLHIEIEGERLKIEKPSREKVQGSREKKLKVRNSGRRRQRKRTKS